MTKKQMEFGIDGFIYDEKKAGPDVIVVAKLDMPMELVNDSLLTFGADQLKTIVNQIEHILNLKKSINYHPKMAIKKDKGTDLYYPIILVNETGIQAELAKDKVTKSLNLTMQCLKVFEELSDPACDIQISQISDLIIVGETSEKQTPFVDNDSLHVRSHSEFNEFCRIAKHVKKYDEFEFNGESFNFHKGDRNSVFIPSYSEESIFSLFFAEFSKIKNTLSFVEDTASKRLINVSITTKIENQALSLLQKINSLHVLDSPKIRVRGTANYKIDFSSGIAQLESIDAQELEIEEM